MNSVKLTMLCEHGGCAAKINAELLEQIVPLWTVVDNDKVSVGLPEMDDVGCYDIGNGSLLLHNIDVITPIVDDGFAFGNIAVAHALSDIYAKGATPISALSFLGVPIGFMSSLNEIIAGCSAKLREAGVVLLGGHTITTAEPLVGFAVTGIIEVGRMVPLRGARKGDKLVLTKPIGSGIISTAMKFSGLKVSGITVTEEEISIAVQYMSLLNKQASQLMMNYDVSACTDVTGFGLLGHLSNLVCASGVSARIYSNDVPKLPGVSRLFQQNVTPTRLDENLKYHFDKTSILKDAIDSDWPILFSPETSGGLLIAVKENQAQELIKDLSDGGLTDSAIIGEITDDSSCKVVVASTSH